VVLLGGAVLLTSITYFIFAPENWVGSYQSLTKPNRDLRTALEKQSEAHQVLQKKVDDLKASHTDLDATFTKTTDAIKENLANFDESVQEEIKTLLYQNNMDYNNNKDLSASLESVNKALKALGNQTGKASGEVQGQLLELRLSLENQQDLVTGIQAGITGLEAFDADIKSKWSALEVKTSALQKDLTSQKAFSVAQLREHQGKIEAHNQEIKDLAGGIGDNATVIEYVRQGAEQNFDNLKRQMDTEIEKTETSIRDNFANQLDDLKTEIEELKATDEGAAVDITKLTTQGTLTSAKVEVIQGILKNTSLTGLSEALGGLKYKLGELKKVQCAADPFAAICANDW